MKLSDYSEEKFNELVSEVDYEFSKENAIVCLDIGLYSKIFKKTARCSSVLWFNKKGRLCIGSTYPETIDGIDDRKVSVSSVKKLVDNNKDIKLVHCAHVDFFLFFNETIVELREEFEDGKQYYRLGTVLTSDDDKFILSTLKGIKKQKSEPENHYSIAIKSSQSIYLRTYKAKKCNIDVEKNYNDDLPIEKIYEILHRKRNDLILFYGVPGGGKTSLIRHLVGKIGKKFIFIDPNLIDSCSNSMLIEFLAENKDSIIVLEDCEKLLRERSEGNSTIGTLLNLTDGIIGELLNIKFICTFNCPLVEIDKAILRKGRLSLKYEFKELSLEKSKLICPEATKPMTLADLYNDDEENDFSKEIKRRIGFGNE